jgi:hypothetical protein
MRLLSQRGMGMGWENMDIKVVAGKAVERIV